MISAIAWIRKGVAKETPDVYRPEDDPMNAEEMAAFARMQIEDAQQMIESVQSKQDDEELGRQDQQEESQDQSSVIESASNDPDLADFDMDNYDTDDGNDGMEEDESENALFRAIGRDFVVHDGENGQDPYIQLEDDPIGFDEERDDLLIRPSDNMVLVGKTDDGMSSLEVYVYDNAEDNLYVHHDIMLPSFPLCIEPVSYSLAEGYRNFAAIGTFQPEIEIWNLDIMDSMYPHCILGAAPPTEKSSKKKSKKKTNPDITLAHHTDAVLSLSHNRLAPTLLASASADHTCKLWDLDQKKCLHTFRHHSDKVSAIQFHPSESSVIVTGSYDQSIAVLDGRSPNDLKRWFVTSDVECLKWNPHNDANLLVSLENGQVLSLDVRNIPTTTLSSSVKKHNDLSGLVFQLDAHEKSVTAMDINPYIPGMLVTGSPDRTVRIWDIQSTNPTLLCSRNFQVGKVFNASFAPDAPYLISVAGSKGDVFVWNVTESGAVRRAFEKRRGPVGEVNMSGPGAVPEDEVRQDIGGQVIEVAAIQDDGADSDDSEAGQDVAELYGRGDDD